MTFPLLQVTKWSFWVLLRWRDGANVADAGLMVS